MVFGVTRPGVTFFDNVLIERAVWIDTQGMIRGWGTKCLGDLLLVFICGMAASRKTHRNDSRYPIRPRSMSIVI